ncbi:hypothetical protein WKI65_40470 [Streptomyces sp. MS1.AVA.3]|uniref:hypothetical protein n=1 Tax=Streptomyces decoyicus TaxID=249567 RepID=UPI0030C5ABA9
MGGAAALADEQPWLSATMAHRHRDNGLACPTSMRAVGLVSVLGLTAPAVVLARICS